MQTIDEILAAMPEPSAEGDHEYLVIDPAKRAITVPEAEKIFWRTKAGHIPACLPFTWPSLLAKPLSVSHSRE